MSAMASSVDVADAEGTRVAVVPGRVIQKRAVRRGKKARIALAGATGSGKTWTALTLAQELAGDGDVLVIDTERGSAALYSDDFEFAILEWDPPYSPIELTKVLETESGNFAVIIVDSLTHFWNDEGGTIAQVDAIAARSTGRENKFAAWNQGTKMQKHMVDAMLAAKCHVIATMRSKMAYVQEFDERSRRQVVRKVGMEPEQRAGMEYEFTIMGELDQEHRLVITKSRCHPIADRMYDPHRAAEMGQTVRDWLDAASEPVSLAVVKDVSNESAKTDMHQEAGEVSLDALRHAVYGEFRVMAGSGDREKKTAAFRAIGKAGWERGKPQQEFVSGLDAETLMEMRANLQSSDASGAENTSSVATRAHDQTPIPF